MKTKLMLKHSEMIRKGNFGIARNILRLMRRGEIRLGLCDDDYFTETTLIKLGLEPHYSRNGNWARFYLD